MQKIIELNVVAAALGFKLAGCRHLLLCVGFRIDESYLGFLITYTGNHLHINMYKGFMVTPCINNAAPFYYQLLHIMLKNTELLKHSKIR